MFEFGTSVVDDIKNYLIVHRNNMVKASKMEDATTTKTSTKSILKSSMKEDASDLLKNTSPTK